MSFLFINQYQETILSVQFHCVYDRKKQLAGRRISDNTQWLIHDQAMNIFNFNSWTPMIVIFLNKELPKCIVVNKDFSVYSNFP